MIAPNRNQPADPYAEAMASTADPYDAIERDLAAEDHRVGEWPPSQWWRGQKAREFSQSIGDPPPINLGTVDDPQYADPGRPLTRREGFWLAATIAAVIVGLLGLAWLAVWVLGVVR